MSDATRDWRPSANVQMPRVDALRRYTLDIGSYAPDEFRSSYGYAPLSAETRSALIDLYAPEQPHVEGTDYFNRGRPAILPAPYDPAPLPPLGDAFLKRNDDAVFARSMSDMLRGQGVDDPTESALGAALNRYRAR